jgi:CRP/FNR family transcriptional regulator, anaerobic regulatory protein
MTALSKILSQYGLLSSDIDQVESLFWQKISFKKGDFFVKENQVVKGMGLVTKGAFRHFYTDPSGQEITHWFTLEGAFLTSFRSFAQQIPATGNLQAIQDAEIIFISKDDWGQLLLENQAIKNIWHRAVEDLLIRLEERLHQFLVFNGEQRYEWLYLHQRRFIEEVPDKYLASMLGITPRHLSRLRAKRK